MIYRRGENGRLEKCAIGTHETDNGAEADGETVAGSSRGRRRVYREGKLRRSASEPPKPKPCGMESYSGDIRGNGTARSRKRARQKRRRAEAVYAAYVSDIKVPQTYEEAIASPQSERWVEAMTKEMESHMQCGTWELEERPRGRRVIGSKWVFTLPLNADNTIRKWKARLVAQGFSQTAGVDYKETWSPVVKKESVRFILAMAAVHNLDLFQDDVSTAYLNADIEEDTVIFMRQPKGFTEPGMVCRVRKALYGLKQSGRLWNKHLHADLTDMGSSSCKLTLVCTSGEMEKSGCSWVFMWTT